jgi:putative ABC transport system permease protein
MRNVKKSFRDYAVYFLTLMFGVCIFYIFNSIESQRSLMILTESQNNFLRILSQIIDVVSVFVSVILGFLIVYANRFLIRRRKKELGIYQILGMGKGRISQILITETVLVAVLSLACGLLIGVFVSQGFAVLTASLFEVKLTEFKFIFSLSATVKAIIYFGISFVFVILFNNIEVGRQKLINLLYADRKNEKFKAPRLVISVIIFIISVICLITAYSFIIENGFKEINPQFGASIILGVIGTFLFFFSLSGFFLKVIQQSKTVYYKGLNMFVLRQLNSRINTAYVSLTMVCLMLFLTICALSSGMGISKSLTGEMERYNPYDATYSIYLTEDIYDDETGEYIDSKNLEINVTEELSRTDIPIESYAGEMAEVKIYNSNIMLPLYDVEVAFICDLMRLSDYNRLLEMQDKPTVIISDNEFILNCTDNIFMEKCLEYLENNKIYSGETEIVLKIIDDTAIYNTSSKAGYGVTFVLPDELAENYELSSNMVIVNYISPTREYDRLFYEVTQQVRANIKKISDERMNLGLFTHLSSRITNFEENKSISLTVAYLAVYLGIVFLIISAVVLAITQLSEASDNIARYELLRKLGADGGMINKALFFQIAVYFIVPLMLAVIHSVVGIKVASNIVFILGARNILRDSIFAAVVITVIYGGYFLATYFGGKRIITID